MSETKSQMKSFATTMIILSLSRIFVIILQTLVPKLFSLQLSTFSYLVPDFIYILILLLVSFVMSMSRSFNTTYFPKLWIIFVYSFILSFDFYIFLNNLKFGYSIAFLGYITSGLTYIIIIRFFLYFIIFLVIHRLIYDPISYQSRFDNIIDQAMGEMLVFIFSITFIIELLLFLPVNGVEFIDLTFMLKYFMLVSFGYASQPN